MFFQRLKVVFNRVVDAEVDDFKARALHHHGNEVLADIVDIALDRADHHLALLGCAGFSQERAQDGHPRLHRVGRHQHFGNKQDAIAEINPDNGHALNQGFGQDTVGRPAAFKEDIDRFNDFILKTIVKVIICLLYTSPSPRD